MSSDSDNHCLGCGQRKMESSKWYKVPENVPDKLTILNDLRSQKNEQSSRAPRRGRPCKRLSPLTEATLRGGTTICSICYNAINPRSNEKDSTDVGGQSSRPKKRQQCSQPRELRRSKRIAATKDSRPLAMEPDPDWESSSDDDDVVENIIMRKTNSSHRFCIFRCADLGPLMDIPKAIRAELHMTYSLYIPSNGCRMCVRHLVTNNWWPLVQTIDTPVPPEDYLEVMRLDRVFYREKGSQNSGYDLNNLHSIPDATFEAMFGYSKLQVEEICQASECQSKFVAALLIKLRTGESNALLGPLFGISERTFGRYLARARDTMHQPMIDAHLTNDRETILQHKTQISSQLLNVGANQGVIAFDASYRFVQKSGNYIAQRRLHCMYKTRNCYKPMVGVAPDGYILYCLGPYQAKKNDAAILRLCFDEDELELLQAGDVLVTDRGFRDVLPYLRGRGLQVRSPSGTAATRLCTLEANRNRLVTKVRWIIEQVFGRLKKKFKYLDMVCHNATLRTDFRIFQIACGLLNMYHTPILSDRGFPGIADAMLARVAVENNLQRVVADVSLEGARIAFNRLQENGRLLAHHTFVLADRAKVGREAIVEYYCSCATGARTMGCCSHVMTILWFLGFAHALLIRGPNPALSHFAR